VRVERAQPADDNNVLFDLDGNLALGVAFTSLGSTSSAPSTSRWLRWTVRDVYVFSTGCVCFKVQVQ